MSMGAPPGADDRRTMIELQGEKIELVYVRSQADKAIRAVIYVLDVGDNLAAKIAKTVMGEAGLKAFQEGAVRRDMAPILIAWNEHEKAVEVLSEHADGAAMALRTPIPDDHFWVVAVGTGGVMYAARPKPA